MKIAVYRGYATILVLLLLVVGLTLTAWLYVSLTNHASIVRNQMADARSLMAAETGLDFMMYDMSLTTASKGFINQGRNSVLSQLAAAMDSRDDQFAWEITANTDVNNPSFSLSSVPLAQGSFTANMALNPTAGSNGFRLEVTGAGENTILPAMRTIGFDLTYSAIDGSSALDFAIAARGEMEIGGSSKVYSLDTSTDPPTPNLSDKGKAVVTANGSVLTFEDSPPVSADSTIVFPEKYLPDAMYAALDLMKERAQLTASKGVSGSKAVMSNVYVPANSGDRSRPVVFDGDLTINGILYVEWPNTIEFGSKVTLNGVIIYAKPPSPPADDKGPVILLGRTLNLTSDPAAAHVNIESAFTNAGFSSDERALFAVSLGNWIVHAPDTNLSLENGKTTGERNFQGSFHIRDFSAAGSGSKDAGTLKIDGQIFCEGDLIQGGNRLYCIKEPDMNDNPYAPRNIKLAVEPGGYWER